MEALSQKSAHLRKHKTVSNISEEQLQQYIFDALEGVHLPLKPSTSQASSKQRKVKSKETHKGPSMIVVPCDRLDPQDILFLLEIYANSDCDKAELLFYSLKNKH
ncbi:expressed unknown protein [Seminavis robusta]|uniref:Uncharacterized protein n=1 Tax=Seminavis robusta TaxID=568900 RepID=A0A9N8DPA2_9STRA|nr:expressed unknown protein [Seminavis robusta]|eukprot:Sro242_g096671.1  (105) ;mRNA; f:57569-57883